MLLIKDRICVAGASVCEDAVGGGAGYLFAMDGASGLSGVNVMDAGSDAAWFVCGVRAGLEQALERKDARATEEILREILGNLREMYESRIQTLHTEMPPDAPSAGLALFRETEEEIEFFGLGDCVGVAEMVDGSLFIGCERMLEELDGRVINRMSEIHRETGIPTLETRAQCNDMLLEHRMLRNTPGGYWILDPSGEGLTHACIRRWKKAEVKRISAYSDGLAQLADTFHIYEDYGALHRSVTEIPLRELVDQLFAAQEDDREANLYPRLKFRDDTCGVWAEVIP